MIPAKLAGVAILGIPLIVPAWVALRRQPRPVVWFAVALVLVGLGYLMATGATDDIARNLMPQAALQPADQN